MVNENLSCAFFFEEFQFNIFDFNRVIAMFLFEIML